MGQSTLMCQKVSPQGFSLADLNQPAHGELQATVDRHKASLGLYTEVGETRLRDYKEHIATDHKPA